MKDTGFSATDMASAAAGGFRDAEAVIAELRAELAALKQPISDEREAFENAYIAELEMRGQRIDRAAFSKDAVGDYIVSSVQGAWWSWQARARQGNTVVMPEPDFYWAEGDEGSWNSPEEWAQDYYDYNGEKPESVSFSCAIELPNREYDSFEFDADGSCISCRLVNDEVARLNPSRGVPAQPEQCADTFCAYCGGNAETPQEHYADCTKPEQVPRELLERIVNTEATNYEDRAAYKRELRALLNGGRE